MRFKKFITEEELDLPAKCGIIKERCSHFLKEAGEYPVYHGQNKETFENETLSLRQTKDSYPWTVSIFNLYIEEKFKIKKIRNEHAVFTTGFYGNAKTYGKIFLFFPEDGYQYIWSPIVRDFFTREQIIWNDFTENIIHEMGEEEGEEIIKILKDGLNDYEKYPTIKDILLTDSNSFKTKSGKNAYYLIRKILVEVFDDLNYDTKYLKSAIESETEIIFKTKKYFLITGDEIDKHFDLKPSTSYDSYKIRYKRLLGLLT